MAAPERDELRGETIDGRYLIGARLGIGGTGVVFDATRLSDGREVAVKTLRPCFLDHPDLGRRLRREAEVARAVTHPGIVPVLDDGTLQDGSPYIVMERVYGESLSRLILRLGTLDPDLTAAIAIRVAAILHSVHRHGYTHRDVKPEHILFDRTSSGELTVRLLDFGVCASPTAPPDERARENGRVYGTPSYVSPEQASGNPDVDGRADLFSLGIVMFEALTGRLPFRASTVTNLLLAIIREDAPRVGLVAPHVSRELDVVVARALARHPEDRFASPRALARALAPHVGQRRLTENRLAEILRVSRPVSDLAPTVPDLVAA